MSEAEQFRQYAEEAMRWASESITEEEERTLIDLACTWAQAAAARHQFDGRSARGGDYSFAAS